MEFVEYKYKNTLYTRRIVNTEIIWKKWDSGKDLDPELRNKLEKDYSIPKNKMCRFCYKDYVYICDFCGTTKVCEFHSGPTHKVYCPYCQELRL